MSFQIRDLSTDMIICANMDADEARYYGKLYGFMRERIEKVIRVNSTKYSITHHGLQLEKMLSKEEVQNG